MFLPRPRRRENGCDCAAFQALASCSWYPAAAIICQPHLRVLSHRVLPALRDCSPSLRRPKCLLTKPTLASNTVSAAYCREAFLAVLPTHTTARMSWPAAALVTATPSDRVAFCSRSRHQPILMHPISKDKIKDLRVQSYILFKVLWSLLTTNCSKGDNTSLWWSVLSE